MASSKRARSVVIKTFQRDNYCSQITNHKKIHDLFQIDFLQSVNLELSEHGLPFITSFHTKRLICDACTLSTDLRLAMSPLGNYHIYLYTDQVTFTLRRSRCYSGGIPTRCAVYIVVFAVRVSLTVPIVCVTYLS